MPPPSRHFDPFRIEWMQTRRNSITLRVGLTPRVIRHTTACHLVLAGVDINTIRAWLGHVSISTTNIYAEIDLTLKANAVALSFRKLFANGRRLFANGRDSVMMGTH